MPLSVLLIVVGIVMVAFSVLSFVGYLLIVSGMVILVLTLVAARGQ